MALDTAWPWANDTYGLCCLRAYFCARKLIRARSYGWDSHGVLAANRNELAERAFQTGGGAGRVLAPLPVLTAGKAHRCWCQLIVRAVKVPYILVPASRMLTGRGILPSYLGLCWCNFI